ncbi:hypothetical protein GE061_015323 [Apolygus lucorum]|uniref:F-box domain-containing protein n=1 Tax=Apolygus lucorum TaxID=248454 RepID=A0A8S9XPP7_APOLU|nr:hypothetical protein GE061_015323 [Apolygus lucorum]
MSDFKFRLPPELLEKIFGYLNIEDIVKCSAVNYLWYTTSRSVLRRKSNMILCRWPDTLPSTVQDACLTGDLTIKFHPWDILKNLRTLKLWYDDPGLLPDFLLERIFNSCEKLNRLEILNVSTIEKHQLECILEHCTPGFRLRISQQHSDSNVLNLLEEYQELFEEIIVELKNPKRVIGWHPIYCSKSTFRLEDSATYVSLTSPGLYQLKLPQLCSVKTLKLEKCSSLDENVLLLLSQLNLESFSIDGFSARASTWISSFKTGFPVLKSFSSINNQIINDETLHALCEKRLENVTLDFRKGLSETSIPYMFKLHHLVRLKIITDKLETNELLKGIKDYWTNLRSLEVEECSVESEDSIRIIETLKSYASKQNITFKHNINCIKFQDNTTGNKHV